MGVGSGMGMGGGRIIGGGTPPAPHSSASRPPLQVCGVAFAHGAALASGDTPHLAAPVLRALAVLDPTAQDAASVWAEWGGLAFCELKETQRSAAKRMVARPSNLQPRT